MIIAVEFATLYLCEAELRLTVLPRSATNVPGGCGPPSETSAECGAAGAEQSRDEGL